MDSLLQITLMRFHLFIPPLTKSIMRDLLKSKSWKRLMLNLSSIMEWVYQMNFVMRTVITMEIVSELWRMSNLVRLILNINMCQNTFVSVKITLQVILVGSAQSVFMDRNVFLALEIQLICKSVVKTGFVMMAFMGLENVSVKIQILIQSIIVSMSKTLKSIITKRRICKWESSSSW